jgi:hypothetical protein
MHHPGGVLLPSARALSISGFAEGVMRNSRAHLVLPILYERPIKFLPASFAACRAAAERQTTQVHMRSTHGELFKPVSFSVADRCGTKKKLTAPPVC